MILSTVHVNIGCDVEVLGRKPSLLILIFNSFRATFGLFMMVIPQKFVVLLWNKTYIPVRQEY